MSKKRFVLALVATVLCSLNTAVADIAGSTKYALDLTNAKKATKVAKWSDPEHIIVTDEGLGWGNRNSSGSQDFWVQTEPIGIGLSWRPTTNALIKAKLDQAGPPGILYVRYSADGKHWTTWQQLSRADAVSGKTHTFQGSLRVPYREAEAYNTFRMNYSRRNDVAWSSDEEALVQEIVKHESKFFEESTPFIGYVQFLYEAQLQGGQRLEQLQATMNWSLSGKHHPPIEESIRRGRDVAWRFKVR